MAQVWSSSTVHFMVQDPLKAIICKILNRKVCIFFKESLRREAGLFNPILCEKWSHSHQWPLYSCGCGWSWRTKSKMSSIFPCQEFFSTGMKYQPGFPLRKQYISLWADIAETLIMTSLCSMSPFSAYFFLLVA